MVYYNYFSTDGGGNTGWSFLTLGQYIAYRSLDGGNNTNWFVLTAPITGNFFMFMR